MIGNCFCEMYSEYICCVIRMYYLFTVQNKSFQIQNTIQYNLMLRRAFPQNPSTQKPTFLILKMEFKCSKELWFLEVQEALQIGIFIEQKLLLNSFFILELWIGLSTNYSKFSYKSRITRKSWKPSVSGKRRFCRTSKPPVLRGVCEWWRLIWMELSMIMHPNRLMRYSKQFSCKFEFRSVVCVARAETQYDFVKIRFA